MISLPIPDPEEDRKYQDVHYGQTKLGAIVCQLTKGKIKPSRQTHLDPDLRKDALPRLKGWRPLFGQEKGAQTHLQKNEVGPGDLFLFYGWFRRTRKNTKSKRLEYDRDRSFPKGFHAIFGWLQVDYVINANRDCPPHRRWAAYHPHFQSGYGSKNTLYVARRRLTLPGLRQTPGGGVFPRLREELQLTVPGSRKRSVWKLPGFFWPKRRLSYHPLRRRRRRWKKLKDGVELRTVAKGQEFVLDTDDYRKDKVFEWLRRLFRPGLEKARKF